MYVHLFLLGFAFKAFSQKAKLISCDYTSAKFEEFVQGIEATTDFHFYYNPVDLDSLSVTVKAKDITITDLLKQVFQNTPYYFAIDPSDHIYITKHVIIQSELPADFFNKQKIRTDSTNDKEEQLVNEPLSREKVKTSVENKLFEIGTKTNNILKGKAILTGYVRDSKNGEHITGASIYVDSLSIGVATDQFGYYSLTLPRGRHELQIYSSGMKKTRRQIILYSDGKLNIDLEDYIPSLKEVIVTAERVSNTRGLQMGTDKLTVKTIKQVPVVFGEADVLRVVLTLPGVTSVGEGSAGFNVRGGSTDQNLILFNDATIYNPTHLFGFFSSFNADDIKEVQLYKSAIPEKYGGRLSSVLDITTKEGNSKKISGTGGIGLLTSKLMIEGPIIKDKTSFIISGRTTYSDWLLHQIPHNPYKNSAASFSDLDLHISHTFNSKNSLYLNGYWSNDQFKLNSDTLYKYGNLNGNIKWKHIFNGKFYNVLTIGRDKYRYSIAGNNSPSDAYKLSFDVQQTNFRTDFSYAPNNKHLLSFGLTSVYYQLHPGTYLPSDSNSLVVPNVVPTEQGLESAIYFGDQYTITPKLSLNAGLRYSLFNYLGPHDEYIYREGVPKDKNTIQDTTIYGSGKVIQTYNAPEIRVAMRYSLPGNSSVKVSYNTLVQYIHMLSNTTAISPTDIWKLSDPHIKPQYGDQISLGYYRNFKSNTIETSLEVYYKRYKNYLDYKSGAEIILNHHIETDVISTKGKAYGAELMIKKPYGKLNGWISYTYSRTLLQSNDPLAGEIVNQGKYYPANYDKPNNLNFIGNYKFSHRYNVSLNVVYSTGRPITLPIAIFNLGGAQRVYYSNRNEYRIPDYFRTDLSFNIEGNHKIKKLTHNSWSFGVYNLTARKNVYSIYFVEENGIIKGYKLSIFGTFIPFVTYNFRF
jgi:hypothetical protein